MAAQDSTKLTDTHRQVIDRITVSFENAWQRGQAPQIELYLRESPQCVETDVLESLLRIDFKHRAQRGQTLPLQHYLTRFPAHRDWITTLYHQGSSATVTRGVPSSTIEEVPDQWFYLRNRLPVGPFTFEQLKKLALSGDLRPKDLVSTRGTPEWVEAGTVQGLFSGPRGGKEAKQPEAGQWIREDYVLLESVGRGGMGEVFKAYRFSLKKEVALKIVRFDRFSKLSPARQHQVLEDFRKEMQATANLRHDNIVSIHDAGDHNGLPFYTMDFVDMNLGKILQYGPLSCKKAAEYIEKIARAVDSANQKGVIHRDIKPSNILVDAGKPILADLGLATVRQRMFEDQDKGQIVGTPPYMAPEQARGEKVDQRTDVYGVGATLYHLITGRPPHQATDRDATLEQVMNEEPLAPRQVNSAIDRDLEAITLKCLEKEPERRYASGSLLADDLHRYLENRPITAQRLTWRVRLEKFARREPIKAGLLGAVLFLITVLLVGGHFYNRWLRAALDTAEKAQNQAEASAKEAESKREEADQERLKSRDTATLLARRVLKKFEKRETGDAGEELLKHVQFCEELLKKDPRDEIKLDLAESYQDLVPQELRKNRRKEAAAILLKCIQLQEELADKNPILKVELGLNFLDLGALYGQLGRRKEEIESDTKALEILEEARKAGYTETVVLAAISQAHVSLGIDYRIKVQGEKALTHQKEAVALLEELNTRMANNVTLFPYQKDLGKAYEELGISLTAFTPPRATEALEYYGKAKRIFESKGQYQRYLAQVSLEIGRAHLQLNQEDQALANLQGAKLVVAQLLNELPPAGPQTDQVKHLDAQILSAQARAHQQKKDAARAEKLYEQSLAIRSALAAKPGNEPILITGLSDLAGFYEKEKNVDRAEPYYAQAIQAQERWVAAEPADYGRRREAGVLWFNKGIFLLNNKKQNEALDCFRAAKQHEIEAFRLTDRSDAYGDYLYMTFQRLFDVYLKLGRTEEAVDTIDERLKLWPTDRRKHFDAAVDLSKVCQRDPSEKILQRTYTVFQRALEQNMLSATTLLDDGRFRVLAANAEFEKLFRKYAGQ